MPQGVRVQVPPRAPLLPRGLRKVFSTRRFPARLSKRLARAGGAGYWSDMFPARNARLSPGFSPSGTGWDEWNPHGLQKLQRMVVQRGSQCAALNANRILHKIRTASTLRLSPGGARNARSSLSGRGAFPQSPHGEIARPPVPVFLPARPRPERNPNFPLAGILTRKLALSRISAWHKISAFKFAEINTFFS